MSKKTNRSYNECSEMANQCSDPHIYVDFMCSFFWGNGSGFKLDLGLFSIKAHSPAKPLIIFAMLSFLRLLLSLEIKNTILLIVSLIFFFVHVRGCFTTH